VTSKRSLRPRAGVALLITLSFTLVPPILISGAWLGSRDAEEAVESFDQDARLIALSIADGIRELISLKVEVLNVTAGTLSAIETWEVDELQRITNAQIKSSASFDSFYVANMDARSIVFAPSQRSDGVVTRAGVNYSDRAYYQMLKASKRPAFGELKLGKQSGVANIHVAVPIYQDLKLKERGPLRGFITAGLRPELITQVVRRILKGSESLRVIVMERSGPLISDSASRLPVLSKPSAGSLFAQPCLTPKERAGSSIQTASIGVVGRDERQVLSRAFCAEISLEDQRWKLWVLTSQEHIHRAAQRSFTLTLSVALLLILVVLVVASALSWALERLMRLVSDNAQRVGEGSFSVTLPEIRWYTPREVIEVGEIVLQTLQRLKDSDDKERELVRDLEQVNRQQAPLVEAWRQVSEAIEIMDAQGAVSFVNPAFDTLFKDQKHRGLSLSSPLMSLKLDRGRAASGRGEQSDGPSQTVGELILKAAQLGEPWSGEVEVHIKQRKRLHQIQSSPILGEGGALLQVVVIHRDVTEERIAQASAAHNDRLAAIGTLAAGMAHEINNPLMYIKTSLELIQEELNEGERLSADSEVIEELSDALGDAQDGVERVSNIVRSLLSIARRGSDHHGNEQLSDVKVEELVKSCVSLTKAELSKRVRLELEIEPQLTVCGRRSELIQVILNLLINASQAMPTRGAEGGEHQGWIRVSGARREGRALIQVSDNASGISDEQLPHIFEPFFSSKPVGEGTGLGLAVSCGIIEAHRGELTVSSQLGVGTTFTISLPLSEAREDEPPTLLPVTPRAPQRILIVDDEPLVAKSLAKLLKGREVTALNSAEEALTLLRAQAFDLILSDVMMPEVDGPTFYQRLITRDASYQRRVIFVTGAAKLDSAQKALKTIGCPVLYKPVTRAELEAAIQACLSKS